MNRDDFHWVSPESLMAPKDFALVQVMRDRYWLARFVDEGQRVEVLMFGKHAPMCNPSLALAERVLSTYRRYGADHVLFLPLTFLPIDPKEY